VTRGGVGAATVGVAATSAAAPARQAKAKVSAMNAAPIRKLSAENAPKT